MTDKTWVRVLEDDYDQSFSVHEVFIDDKRELVEVDTSKYEEYCELVNRLGELEDYFLSFESEADKDSRLFRERAVKESNEAYEKAQACIK